MFVEDKTGLFTYQSRLYLDGKDLFPPKPVIVNERNPRIVANGDDIDNDADLNFDHLMLNNKVELIKQNYLIISRFIRMALENSYFKSYIRTNCVI